MGFFNELFSLGKEFGEILRDGRREFGEIMTDGFREMVIKGNDDYKTSYEKKEEAERIVSKAESYYQDVQKDVKNTCDSVNNMIEDHYKYKLRVYRQLRYDYENVIYQLHNRLRVKKIEFTLSNFELATSSDVNVQHSLLLGVASVGIAGMLGQIQRVREADNMLEEAKKFKAKVDMECEKLRKLKANVLLIEKKIKEERSLIEGLRKHLNQKTVETDNALDASIQTENEILEIEKAIGVIELLKETVETKFLKDGAIITSQYEELLTKLYALELRLKGEN